MSTLAVHPLSTMATATAAAASSTPAASSGDSLANEDVFLQLLVAQLKNQDPENPSDGTQFVTQLAQFTTLEQDTQSRTDLDKILAGINTLTAALPVSPAAASTIPSSSGN